MLWEGVRTETIYQLVKPNPKAKFLMIHSMEGYTSTLRLEEREVRKMVLSLCWKTNLDSGKSAAIT